MFKGSRIWEEVSYKKDLAINETAILICDMWDKHWCSGAEKRVKGLAPSIAATIKVAQARGILIIHSPSGTMSFYKKYPQRQRMLNVVILRPPLGRGMTDPPLPIDDSGNGCETGEESANPPPWTRQHAAIPIAEGDVISDDGISIYSLLAKRGVKNLFVMGVHTNWCILNRPFGIKQMSNWGVRCILVRDLTDAMYDPKKAPFVSHGEGTELVVRHIERHWCPSTLSGELVTALRESK